MNVRYFFSLSFILCIFQVGSICADACSNLDFIRRYNGAQGKIMQEPVYFRKNRKRCSRRKKDSCNRVVAQQNNAPAVEDAMCITQAQQPSDSSVIKF
jgi:hypothetical protein